LVVRPNPPKKGFSTESKRNLRGES
jgi:hypothetical protein